MCPSKSSTIHIEITRKIAGFRMDKVLAKHEKIGSLSRSQIKRLHDAGHLLVNNVIMPLKYKVMDGDVVDIYIPAPVELTVEPENIPLDIIYEDKDIIVINKQAGLVVHPSPGHSHSTLVHGLLYHCKDLSGIGGVLRPGIVHRLDKDTSGVLIVAKNDSAHHHLVKQFKDRLVKKTYTALLAGCPDYINGTVSTLLGRHPIHRKKMAVLERSGKLAISHWNVVESFEDNCHVSITIETGRTHQIRVHMAHIGCPVLGDTLYGGKKAKCDTVSRQCLHASMLTITHPVTLKSMRFRAPLPDDIKTPLQLLQHKEDDEGVLARQICVTGAIGSGKSRVAKKLAQLLDFAYIDVDLIAKTLMGKGGAGLSAVLGYNPLFINADGSLDRKALRRAIFENSAVKKDIDRLIHPLVQEELISQVADLSKDAVIEIPLLFETGWDVLFDTVILVLAPKELCVERVIDRDKVSKGEAEKAYDCQLDMVTQQSKADFVIVNNDWSDTLVAIEDLAQSYLDLL